jgi:hypothetical protein
LPAHGKDGAVLPAGNRGNVLVFEQAPNFSMVTTGSTATSASKGKWEAIQTNDALYTAQPYRLMSPSGGWRLRSLFDSWDREWVYRFFADRSELNAVANTSEDVAGDEQTVPPLEGKADGAVRPAVAEYAFPYFMSAGADGKWGAFIDGTSPDFARNAVADKKLSRDADAMDNLYSQEASR